MDIFKFLSDHQIQFERYDHAAVYTCAEANEIVPNLPGVKTKNLFLRDRKGERHFLVIVPSDKPLDLSHLAALLETDRISFGSAERLKKYLGIEAGAVSLLAIICDSSHAVELIIEKSVWDADAIQCHPLVNTSTLVIQRGVIRTLLEKLGRTPKIISL